jgi:hypothetical protein
VLAVEEPLEIRLGNMSYNLDAGFLVFEGIIWIQAEPFPRHRGECGARSGGPPFSDCGCFAGQGTPMVRGVAVLDSGRKCALDDRHDGFLSEAFGKFTKMLSSALSGPRASFGGLKPQVVN